jgi:hypothetical protein
MLASAVNFVASVTRLKVAERREKLGDDLMEVKMLD